ncbi:MAG: peptide-methionine (S)-S-oxide reductase MsrA [Alphaproteobacteria bacterium]|nr:peptide-methionine (S)-S-oxide reductase MsrA [Alphaproteobacteria bacterium]
MATEKIILAGGCFWGMQSLIDQKDGIIKTRVGYAGGDDKYKTYDFVKLGITGHAESVEVTYDTNIITTRQLIALFLKIHDPTTFERQGNDSGSQYRSAVFYMTDAQKQIVEKAIKDANETGLWGNKIITEVKPFTNFFQAEEEHQKYLEKTPNGYSCHYPRSDWNLPN